METLRQLLDLFLHLDVHLGELIERYDHLVYLILFGILFCETGLVVTPFLPGDSLLFAAGAFAAVGKLDLIVLLLSLSVAAILGDTVNYWVGKRLGLPLFDRFPRVLKREHLARTHRFYERHGGKTIIIARFVPIVRTFAPFVAGVGTMNYARFLAYNVAGGLLWVLVCTLAGYFFGNMEFVKRNFSLVILVIMLISVLPIVIEYIRHRRAAGEVR